MESSVAIERRTKTAPVSENVVSAVAATKGMDPMALDPLIDVIDPDALDTLYARNGLGRGRSPDRIAFNYCGCEVVITGDGSVTVSTIE